jgi:choline dehydrogenase-like flavoprotein
VHGVYVADASVLPTCPEVNPQLTIMAMALAVAGNAAA